LRDRLLALGVWFLAFMLPLYVEGEGLTYSSYHLVFRILSSALIYGFVTAIWPSFIMHLLAYLSAYRALKGKARSFLAYAAAAYLLIGVGQSTAIVEGRAAFILSNMVLIVVVGLLWLKDLLEPVRYEGLGPKWFFPLALFAFISPFSATATHKPPWFWMWEAIVKQPVLAIPAVVADALAGFGSVAFCLFTPLALTVAGKAGALRPITLRMTSMPGIAFSSIIIGSAIHGIVRGSLSSSDWVPLVWNAVLHVPLLVVCSYYFLVKVRGDEYQD